MANTLLLDRTQWDLCIDIDGNIAMASDPYAIVQDACSAIRLFQGDYWYNVDLGIPYFNDVLGMNPPVNLLKELLITAAETVPGVTQAAVYLTSIENGQVSGQLQINEGTLIANF